MAEDAPVLSRIALIDWDQLHACGGVATAVPHLIREIVQSPSTRGVELAWGDLVDSVCHQGITIYDVTPVLVPVVAAIADAPASSLVNRVNSTRFLATVAMAREFCLPDGTVHRAAWRRRSAAPTPRRDISLECRRAVGSVAPGVLNRPIEYPPGHRVWYVALAVSVFEYLDVGDVRRLLALPGDGSTRLAGAVEILNALTSGTTTPIPWIERLATLDESVSEELSELMEEGSAPEVLELARCVAYRLAEVDGSEA